MPSLQNPMPLALLASMLFIGCTGQASERYEVEKERTHRVNYDPFTSDYGLLQLSVADPIQMPPTKGDNTLVVRGIDFHILGSDVPASTSPYNDGSLSIVSREDLCHNITIEVYGYGSKEDGFPKVTVNTFFQEDISPENLHQAIRTHLNTARTYVGSSNYRSDLQDLLAR